MTKLTKRMEELFTDITFAEDREFKSARKFLNKSSQALENVFTAIAFAEAGEFETAVTYINKNDSNAKDWCDGNGVVNFIQHRQDLISAGR